MTTVKKSAQPGVSSHLHKEDFFSRLQTESEELFDKLQALETFITMSPVFYHLDKTQRGLLHSQLHVMLTYYNILNLRIETLNK